MKKMGIVIFMLAFVAEAQAQEFGSVGTAGAQFLQIGVSARAIGLGEAYTAVTNDALSIFWNPAGLAQVERHAWGFSYVSWLADVRYQTAAYAYTWERVGTLGAGVGYLTSGEMEVRRYGDGGGTGETFTYSDLVVGLSFARNLTDKFAVGGQVKYIQEKAWTQTARGWAIDVGTMYKTGFRGLRLAMAIQNFGPEMRFSGNYVDYSDHQKVKSFQSYPLPLTFRGGLAMDLITTEQYSVLVAADLLHPNDNVENYDIGTEVTLFDKLLLRGGYKFNTDEEGLAFGAGLRYPIGSMKISLDYAFDDVGLLGNVHRGSVGFAF